MQHSTPLYLLLLIPPLTFFTQINCDKTRSSTTQCLSEIINKNFRNGRLLTVLVEVEKFVHKAIIDDIMGMVFDGEKRFVHVTNGTWVTKNMFESFTRCKINCWTNSSVLGYVFKAKYRSYSYLIIVDTTNSFRRLLMGMKRLESFNRNAKILVYLELDQDESIFYVLNDFYNDNIYNVVIFAHNSNYTRIYSLDIFDFKSGEKCGGDPNLKMIDECKDGELTKKSQLFNLFLKPNYNDCIIKGLTMIYPPFVIDLNNGFEIELIREIVKRIHAKIVIDIEDVEDWGEINLNRTYDLAFGNIQTTPEIYEDFELTESYYNEQMIWVVPKAQKIDQFNCLFLMFSPNVWLLNGIILVLFSSLFYFTSLSYNLTIIESILLSIQTFIGAPVPKKPTKNVICTIFISFALYSIIINVLYNSSLINILTNPVYERQILSEDDLLQPSIQIGGPSIYKEFFNESHEKSSDLIYKKYLIENKKKDTLNYWIKKVGNNKNVATISTKMFANYLLKNTEDFKIFILPKILFSFHVKIAMSKGNFLLYKFDQQIKRFQRAGLIEKWRLKYSKIEVKVKSDDKVVLKMNHLSGAFYVLCVGYVLGGIVFVIERIYWIKRCKK
ncbi:uncharacterized protein [Onthophagus taurus]|uniref:uncharacterized protein n=1 Tax=Onthophagus taurus TaxID=166361 RepID=UPI0039BDDDF2